jgi:flavin reductase (DIM6/NTAB) family NADH-FMN oxidoreductase RutF
MPGADPSFRPEIASKQFDCRELRDCLSTFVTGVTVITTVDREGARYGLTVNSFSSVSLDPPLILWSQRLVAPSFPIFRDAPYFAVNILAENQIDISRRFSSNVADKFADLDVIVGHGGIPLIAGCAAYLECSTESTFSGGDHLVFIGRVQGMKKLQHRPLAFGGGRYMIVQPHDLA